jgi:hypothetical protein
MATSKERNPVWVAKAKSDAASSFFAEGDEHRGRLIEIINQLASAKGIASAWKALENRFADFEVRRERSVQETVDRLMPFEKLHRSLSQRSHQGLLGEMHVYGLAEVCFRAYDGFEGFVRLSKQDQSDRAKKIAKQARDLAKTLAPLMHPIFGMPEEFDLDGAAMDLHLKHYLRLRTAYANESLWNEDWHAGYCAGGYDFAHITAGEMPRLLSSLGEAAEAWGKNSPTIAKPTSKEAHRTYFIKCLASYFAEEYGDAMHATVLAFTKVFFKNASTLNVSNVIDMTTGKRKRVRASRP